MWAALKQGFVTLASEYRRIVQCADAATDRAEPLRVTLSTQVHMPVIGPDMSDCVEWGVEDLFEFPEKYGSWLTQIAEQNDSHGTLRQVTLIPIAPGRVYVVLIFDLAMLMYRESDRKLMSINYLAEV